MYVNASTDDIVHDGTTHSPNFTKCLGFSCLTLNREVTVNCLQMFCTALPPQHTPTPPFLDYCKYDTWRRCVTAASSHSQRRKELNSAQRLWNLLMPLSSILLSACWENLACQWMLQMPYKRKKTTKKKHTDLWLVCSIWLHLCLDSRQFIPL